MSAPLLQTKLHPPRAPRALVRRPRLVERLSAARGGDLILISAPAGFGKTTLVLEWLEQCALDAAWLSLDEDDSDPTSLAISLGAAMAPVLSVDASELAPDSPLDAPGLMTHMAGLINGVMRQPHTIVLVLDDYHELEGEAVHSGIEYLVEHLPQNLILCITSRTDPPWPLGRRRARRELIEIRGDDLRFTVTEAAELLNDLEGLSLSPEQLEVLRERTEGWIAGLQLAAVSLRERDDAAGFLRSFAGSDRFVLDYLVEEVFSQQEPEMQRFLLVTSVLDKLSAPLCDALTGRSDGRKRLREIEERNLFLIPLDSERRWYRYHHLFADLLRGLADERFEGGLPRLHLRASEAGERLGLLDEAISHAFRSGEMERAISLVEEYGYLYLDQNRFAVLARWAARIPESTIRRRPRLALLRAWMSRRGEDPEPWIEAAMAAGVGQPAPDGLPYASFCDFARASAAVLRADRGGGQGATPDEILGLIDEADALIHPEDLYFRRLSVLLRGLLYQMVGDDKDAARYLDESRRLDEALSSGLTDSVLSGNETSMLWEEGRLDELAELCERAIAEIESGGSSKRFHHGLAAVYYIYLGRTRVQRNRLDEALPLLRRGVQLASDSMLGELHANAWRSMAKLRVAQGRLDDALECLEEASALADLAADPEDTTAMLDAIRARIWLWLARITGEMSYLDRAVRWAEKQCAGPRDDYSFEMQSLAWVRIAQRRENPTVDLGTIHEILDHSLGIAMSSAIGSTGHGIEILTLQAMAYQAEGREDEALQALSQALERAEQERFLRHIMDHGRPMRELLELGLERGMYGPFAAELVAAMRAEEALHRSLGLGVDGAMAQVASPKTSTPALPESLTERELEILRYLGGHLSSTEIAEELVVSPNTVRFHIKNVYGKLGAHSRRDAIERAEELGLL